MAATDVSTQKLDTHSPRVATSPGGEHAARRRAPGATRIPGAFSSFPSTASMVTGGRVNKAGPSACGCGQRADRCMPGGAAGPTAGEQSPQRLTRGCVSSRVRLEPLGGMRAGGTALSALHVSLLAELRPRIQSVTGMRQLQLETLEVAPCKAAAGVCPAPGRLPVHGLPPRGPSLGESARAV